MRALLWLFEVGAGIHSVLGLPTFVNLSGQELGTLLLGLVLWLLTLVIIDGSCDFFGGWTFDS